MPARKGVADTIDLGDIDDPMPPPAPGIADVVDLGDVGEKTRAPEEKKSGGKDRPERRKTTEDLTERNATGTPLYEMGHSAIAPQIQPPPTEMEPVYNYLGKQIGERPKDRGLFQNPFAPPSATANAPPTPGGPNETERLLAERQKLQAAHPELANGPHYSLGENKVVGAQPAIFDQSQSARPMQTWGGGGGYVKPSMQTVGRTIQHGADVREANADFQKAREYENKSIDQGVESELEGAKRTEHGLDVQAGQLEGNAAQQRIAENRRAHERGIKNLEIGEAERDASADKIDPEHFWKTRTTGQKIAGFIGLALGGFAQGLRGGQNPAMEMINKAINDDIGSQEANVMLKKAKYNRAKEGMQELDKEQEQERRNEEEQRKMSWGAAIAQLDRIAAGPFARNPEVQSKANHLRSLMEMQMGTHALNAAQIGGDRVTEQQHLVGGGGPGGPKVKPIDQALLIRDEKGQWAVARSEKEAQDIRQAAATLPQVKRYFEEAIAIRNEPGWWANPAKRQRLHALQTLAEPKISKMGDNSVLRDGEREEMRDSVTTFTSPVPGTNDNLQKTVNGFTQSYTDHVRSQSAPLAQYGYGVTADGQLVPMAQYTGENVNQQNMNNRPASQLPSYKPAGSQ